MKPRSFAALAIVAALSVLISVVSFASNNRWSQAKVTGVALFPDLAAQAGRIAKIELAQGSQTLTLARGDKQGWVLADRAGYPAKSNAVRALLVKLVGAELVEPKTRKKDRYSLLELDDPAGKDAKSHRVRLLDEKGASIAEAIVGKRRYDAFGSMKGGTYVRKPGDVQTWLANADIDASPRVRDWVEPGVFDLGTRKITQMTIELPGEQPLKIEQDSAGAGKYKLVSIPDGKKLKQGTDVDAIPRAAGFIEMDDVRKLAQTPVGDVNTVNIAAEGGLSIVMRLRKQGDDYWLSMTATGEGDAKKAAETITSKVQGWEFKIPLSKAQAILKRPADLFEAS